ncbi:hypothetical protein [Paenibacillus odorifer]|uniref:Uncharacterized protein n=1 Tax=Paenibacillus odorifer TaxID=189426 RepID=A0A1R0XEQ9_9BACL|nr:hypothetical protein [Paenibacillus odorifer]OMD33560.1 hypothetical protein BJP51_12305 [Paenibacillus odorifer]
MAQAIEIGYALDRRTGNFIVTKIDHIFPARSRFHRQQIVVLPNAFFRALPSVDRRSVANVIDITANQAHELGFIVREKSEVAAYGFAVTA